MTKLLEENTGKTFSDINHGSVFLVQSRKAIEIKQKKKHKKTNETNQIYKLLYSKGNHNKKKKKKHPKN